MLLDEKDGELLEFVALSEPWSIVCGEFCARYGSVETLVARLLTLDHEEYVEIVPEAGAAAVSAQALLLDAASHDFYEDILVADTSGWTITATDKGFAAVRDRLREQ